MMAVLSCPCLPLFDRSQFMSLYNRQPNAATANYNLEVMRDFRGERFQDSVSKNPYFFCKPALILVVNAPAAC